MVPIEIIDDDGKILGFADRRRLPTKPDIQNGLRIDVPIMLDAPIRYRHNPSIDYAETTHSRATFEWRQIRFFDRGEEVAARWYLVARSLPDAIWKDRAFIQQSWQ
jgi:hypothetical protein